MDKEELNRLREKWTKVKAEGLIPPTDASTGSASGVGSTVDLPNICPECKVSSQSTAVYLIDSVIDVSIRVLEKLANFITTWLSPKHARSVKEMG